MITKFDTSSLNLGGGASGTTTKKSSNLLVWALLLSGLAFVGYRFWYKPMI